MIIIFHHETCWSYGINWNTIETSWDMDWLTSYLPQQSHSSWSNQLKKRDKFIELLNLPIHQSSHTCYSCQRSSSCCCSCSSSCSCSSRSWCWCWCSCYENAKSQQGLSLLTLSCSYQLIMFLDPKSGSNLNLVLPRHHWPFFWPDIWEKSESNHFCLIPKKTYSQLFFFNWAATNEPDLIDWDWAKYNSSLSDGQGKAMIRLGSDKNGSSLSVDRGNHSKLIRI